MRNPFLEHLIGQTEPGEQIPGTFWATVVGTSPLRVQRDTEPVLAVTPKTLEKVSLGDRVLCLWERRQVIILGKMGGNEPETPYLHFPSQNRILIDGTIYKWQGSIVCPSFTWAQSAHPVYATTVNVTVTENPNPPSPWTYRWAIQTSSGFSICQAGNNRYPTNGSMDVRLFQFFNGSTTAIGRLAWQLVNA